MKKTRTIGEVSLSRDRGSVAARRNRRGDRRRAWGHPLGWPHPARHAGRTAQRYRMGLDHRRRLVRLDQQARRAGDLRAARHRADHPPHRARPSAMGRRRGGGDPARARRRLRWRRLVKAAHGLVARADNRISAQGHARSFARRQIARDLSAKGVTRQVARET